MKRVRLVLPIVCFWVAGLCFGVLAQEQSEEQFKYGGGKATCKSCHLSKKSGAQYKIWEAGPHAKAFETLQSDKAEEVGKKLGVDNPAASDKCLKCHVTAFGVEDDLKGPKFSSEEGVACEACHGPGSGYKSRKVMKDLYAGTLDPAAYGLIKPVTEKVCVRCHNKESPTYEKFVFEEKFAKIEHPVPKD